MITMAENVSVEVAPKQAFQLRLIVLAVIAMIIDGFDIQAIAFAGPALLQEWGVTRTALAPAVGAALLGMAFGAPLGGAIGDRFGRRTALILAVGMFGTATFAAAWSSGISSLALLRFISGIGFGAVLPNTTALLAEWIPARVRPLAIGLMVIGVPLGGMLGAAVAGWLIPVYGWRACFLVGGVAGLVVMGLLVAALPESLRYLRSSGGTRERIQSLERVAFGPALPPTDSQETVVDFEGWAALLAKERRRTTVGLCLAFFANLLVAYTFFSWGPILLTTAGLSMAAALQGSFFFNIWGLPGAIAGSLLVSRVGSRTGLVTVAAGMFVSVIALERCLTSPGNEASIYTALSAVGACMAALQSGLYALAAQAYATSFRSRGIGLAAGVGRLGAMASAFAGGAVLSISHGPQISMWLLAAAAVIAMVGVLTVDRHTSFWRSTN